MTNDRLREWEVHLLSVTSELSNITGLPLVYAGVTATALRNAHPGGRTATDILFYVMPPGPIGDNYGTVLEENLFSTPSSWWLDSLSGPWGEIYSRDIVVSATYVNDESLWWKAHLMYNLGIALGLDGLLDDRPHTEIMGWVGQGSGTYGNPAWGPGDLIALRLVGANNGCLN